MLTQRKRNKKPTQIPSSLFDVVQLLLGVGPALMCVLPKTSLEKVDFSFVGGYQLQLASRLEVSMSTPLPRCWNSCFTLCRSVHSTTFLAFYRNAVDAQQEEITS